MGKAEWYFRQKFPDEKDDGNSGSKDFFKKNSTESLVREICQNSLDARSEDSECVRVQFCFQTIKTTDFKDVFFDALPYVNLSEKEREKSVFEDTKNNDRGLVFLKRVKELLGSGEIDILKIRDFGTTGLRGIGEKHGNKEWTKMVESNGDSNKNGAGSYGVGKMAAVACSELSMVFYGTRLENGETGFQGRFWLPPLQDENGTPLHNEGDFCVVKNEGQNKVRSFISPNDECAFRDFLLSDRSEPGTDVIIVGLSKEFSEKTQNGEFEDNLVSRICRNVIVNFFPAILQGKLIVEIREDGADAECKRIDKETLVPAVSEIIGKNHFSSKKDKDKMEITRELISVMNDCGEGISLDVRDECGSACCWIKRSNSEKSRISYFRRGMKIEDKNFVVAAMPVLGVVLIKEDTDLEGKLRNAEPPEHNRWDPKESPGSDMRNEIKKAIHSLRNAVKEFVEKHFPLEKTEVFGGGDGLLPADSTDEKGGASDPLTVHAHPVVEPPHRREQRNDGDGETPVVPPIPSGVGGGGVGGTSTPGNGGGVRGPRVGKTQIRIRSRAFVREHEIFKVILIPEENYDAVRVRFHEVEESSNNGNIGARYNKLNARFFSKATCSEGDEISPTEAFPLEKGKPKVFFAKLFQQGDEPFSGGAIEIVYEVSSREEEA